MRRSETERPGAGRVLARPGNDARAESASQVGHLVALRPVQVVGRKQQQFRVVSVAAKGSPPAAPPPVPADGGIADQQEVADALRLPAPFAALHQRQPQSRQGEFNPFFFNFACSLFTYLDYAELE